MASAISKIVIFTLSLYVCGMMIFTILSQKSSNSPAPQQQLEVIDDSEITPEDNPIDYTYNFIDSKLANLILTELDVYKPLDESYFIGRSQNRNFYDVPYLGLKQDEEYCKKHREFFTNRAETLFEDIFLIIEGTDQTFIRSKVVPDVATDIQPEVAVHHINQSKFDINHGVNAFFTWSSLYPYQKLGKHFSCLTQMSNHIPGNQYINRKNSVAESLSAYIKKFQDRPHCPVTHKYFLKNWLLYEKEDCQDFFRILNSQEYHQTKQQKQIKFIRKIGAGSHRGAGVQPVTQEEEDDLRGNYSNGELCGQVDKNIIIQDFVQNPLLINGRKFDFRFYVLIASTNPLIAYYYDGLLRISLDTYDVSGGEKRSLLTNLALSKDLYEKAENKTQVLEDQMWDFHRFQDYLMKAGIITDPNWLENHLRPEFKKAVTHILRSVEHRFLKDSSLYEVFGVDFILDTDLNVWFLEANSGPSWDGDYTVSVEKVIVDMLKDHFDITYGLLSSRLQRIVGFVNNMILTDQVEKLGQDEILIRDVEEKIKEFKEVTKNHFEPRFAPEEGNKFVLIIDENLDGVDKYQNLLSEDCL